MSKKDFNKTPQELVHNFWDKYFTKKPGKVTSIFPRSLYATLLPPSLPRGASSARNAAESYEAAAKECREKVDRIVQECYRINEKYTDPDFDIESDWAQNCLKGLICAEPEENASSDPLVPGSVHRVDWIFDKPQFTADGFSSSDIKQGIVGDCWWVAAVATIANRRDLMNKICVARDEQVGVYGFVFYRDGEWISVVVDDNLYLISEDFDYSYKYDATGKLAREHRNRHQTGSEALFFSKCDDQNETWLPLLEKAYAKAHGDYAAIEGGYSSQGVEDMTGGVGTNVNLSSVLNRDKLWKELVNADSDFVFACSVVGSAWDDGQKGGLATGHAYSILKATEEVDEDGNKVRLVLIRNPWGERAGTGVGEWNGPWSDGSKEWTPYWLKKLSHTFGNDGIFWMSFEDVMNVFKTIYRTRLFDEKWTVVQQWTSMSIGWIAGYLDKKFIIDVKKAGTVVVVMSQLDDRYFQGFTGQYDFILHFVLQKEGEMEQHICRARPVHGWDRRSVSCEVDLEPGRYEVLPKITSERDTDGKLVEDVVREYADKNPAKLRQVGMQYDLAHAKGGVPDEDEILTKKQEEKKAKVERRKKRAKEQARRDRYRVITTTTVTNDTVETKTEQVGGEKKDVQKGDGAAKDVPAHSKEDSKEDEKFEDAVEEAGKTEDEKKGDNSGDAKPEEVAKKEDKKDEEKKEEEKKEEEKKEEEKKEEKVEEGKTEEKKEEEAPAGEEVKNEDGTPAAEEDLDTESESEDEEETIEYEEGHVPWNAVCVVGLRVYSQDSEVTVTLAEPKDVEEGGNLVVDNQAVGSTM